MMWVYCIAPAVGGVLAAYWRKFIDKIE